MFSLAKCYLYYTRFVSCNLLVGIILTRFQSCSWFTFATCDLHYINIILIISPASHLYITCNRVLQLSCVLHRSIIKLNSLKATPRQLNRSFIVPPQLLSTTITVLITSCIDQNLSTIHSAVANYLRLLTHCRLNIIVIS